MTDDRSPLVAETVEFGSDADQFVAVLVHRGDATLEAVEQLGLGSQQFVDPSVAGLAHVGVPSMRSSV